MNAQEEWLVAHTFYCKGLSARITPEQCRINKEAVGRNEVWACKKCKDYKLIQKEALPMSISENVKRETIAALRSSQNQSQAAARLGIKQPSLYWRIMQDKEIHAVADELGFLRKKATGGGVMRKRRSVSEKPELVKHEGSVCQKEQVHDLPEEARGENYPFKDKPAPEAGPQVDEFEEKPEKTSPPPGISVDPSTMTAEIIIKLSVVPLSQLRGVMEMMGAAHE